MGKVSFILVNRNRATSAVRAKVVNNGIPFTYNPQVSVEVSKFGNGRLRACPEAGAVNNRLDAVEAAIKNTLVYFNRTFSTPSAEDFRKKVNQFLAGDNAIQISRQDRDFLIYVDRFIKDSDMSYETKKGYITCKNKLIDYWNKKGNGTLTFDDITLSFEKKFKKWLVADNYSRNYIGTLIKNIMKFMSEAEKVDKLHTNRDYESFIVESETADTIYLSTTELEKIHNLEFTDKLISKHYKETRVQNIEVIRRSLDSVRKKFLCGAVCAMRVSDYSRILDIDVDKDVITIIPRKGSTLRKPEPIQMPLHRILRDIIGSGFDINSTVKDYMINRQIKTICQMAGINEMVTCRITKGREIEESTKEKWEWVTSHTARRSGATNMYLEGVPFRLIRGCTGHKSDAMLLKYIKAEIKDDLEELRQCRYFR